MFMKKLGCRVHGCSPDYGRLALRLAVAIPFVYAGWFKLANADMVSGMMASFGFPGWSGPLLGLIEVVGGIALVLGTYVQVVSCVFIVIMLAAIYLVTGKMGFATGYQLNVILILGLIALAKLGAGAKSLDAKNGACSCMSVPLGKGDDRGSCGDDDACCDGMGNKEECCGSGACGSDKCEMPEEADDHVVVVEDGEIVAVEEAHDHEHQA